MKGKILDYSIQKSSGVITCNYENRYTFNTLAWQDSKSQKVGQAIDFKIDGKEEKL